ncbi:MAG TPA: hypothetical protein EYP25_08715 [Anaerolineae bacterium]|nr:hypothetical protein [Anaerolineae bacterium]
MSTKFSGSGVGVGGTGVGVGGTGVGVGGTGVGVGGTGVDVGASATVASAGAAACCPPPQLTRMSAIMRMARTVRMFLAFIVVFSSLQNEVVVKKMDMPFMEYFIEKFFNLISSL